MIRTILVMNGAQLQEECERAQEALMRMEYLDAERMLAAAEEVAWGMGDFDTLARLYMPLQEARRQRRQRCGEGIVNLDLIIRDDPSAESAEEIIGRYPFGQLLVAAPGSIRLAAEVRRLGSERKLYVETFLGAFYAIREGEFIAIVPLESSDVPTDSPRSLDELRERLARHSVVIPAGELPAGESRGTAETYARVMGLWERLHRPFLEEADARTDPIERMRGYRRAIEVDYACELAHQRLSDTARTLAQTGG